MVQWSIIAAGCGCPKSTHFLRAMKETVLHRESPGVYKLIITSEDVIDEIYNIYSAYNNAGVQKHYKKLQAKKKAEEVTKRICGTSFYIVGGVLTTEKPNND